MPRSLSQLTEAQIAKAEAEGKLSGLDGEGKPLPNRPGDALIDGADAAGFRIMAQAGVVPEEIALKGQLAQARADWAAAQAKGAVDAREKKRLMARIAELNLRYEIAREARQKFLR